MSQNEDAQQDQTRHLYPRIVSKPGILYGKPVIEGTRLSVEVLLESLSRGDTFDEILEDYPFITREDITAAIEYNDRQWDELLATPESQAFLAELSANVDEAIARGDVEDGGWTR